WPSSGGLAHRPKGVVSRSYHSRSKMEGCRVRHRLPYAVLVVTFSAWSSAADRYADRAHDPDVPYQAKKSKPVSYDVDFSVVVTAPYRTKVLKIWLPLPQSDRAQQVVEGELTSFP